MTPPLLKTTYTVPWPAPGALSTASHTPRPPEKFAPAAAFTGELHETHSSMERKTCGPAPDCVARYVVPDTWSRARTGLPVSVAGSDPRSTHEAPPSLESEKPVKWPSAKDPSSSNAAITLDPEPRTSAVVRCEF